MKTPTKPGIYQDPIAFTEYPFNHYLEFTKELRKTDKFIISYKKPQKATSTNQKSYKSPQTLAHGAKPYLEKK